MSLLQVHNATVRFKGPGGSMKALDDVSLNVEEGEIVAVVGESGCGKTTLARAILGLQTLDSGSVELLGETVVGHTPDQSTKVGMVWQDPYASLDPRWTMEKSASEPALLAGKEINLQKLFDEVGLAETHRQRFPHQLSGGQRQRVAIARAIALRPPLIICDEPTAALDLSIRAQILNLLKKIRRELGCSFLYISHDLTTVRFLADRVAVMYLGQIVESGPAEQVFGSPKHPYTRALLDSAPTLETLGQIPGAPVGELPDPFHLPSGCRFAPRCPKVGDICQTQPPIDVLDGDRRVYCHFPL